MWVMVCLQAITEKLQAEQASRTAAAQQVQSLSEESESESEARVAGAGIVGAGAVRTESVGVAIPSWPRASGDSSTPSSSSTSPGTNMPLSPADLYGMWYPTVRRALTCISKMRRCLDVCMLDLLVGLQNGHYSP